MIRSLIELVPFGDDKYARNISGMYLANVGETPSAKGFFDYIVGYYEPPSCFSPEGIRKYKYIYKHDRKDSTFSLLAKIYDLGSTVWFNNDELDHCDFYDNYVSDVIARLDARAEEDLGWNFR